MQNDLLLIEQTDYTDVFECQNKFKILRNNTILIYEEVSSRYKSNTSKCNKKSHNCCWEYCSENFSIKHHQMYKTSITCFGSKKHNTTLLQVITGKRKCGKRLVVVGCRFESNCPLVGPETIGGMPSWGISKGS